MRLKGSSLRLFIYGVRARMGTKSMQVSGKPEQGVRLLGLELQVVCTPPDVGAEISETPHRNLK